jgi:hypothetical protein
MYCTLRSGWLIPVTKAIEAQGGSARGPHQKKKQINPSNPEWGKGQGYPRGPNYIVAGFTAKLPEAQRTGVGTNHEPSGPHAEPENSSETNSF